MAGLKSLSFALVGVALSFAVASAASADVHVTVGNGRVTIVATNATLREILAEWARVGQVKIVNLDRIPGGPMSVELPNMPEAQALDVLLRTMSGYIAAPRAVAVANVSQFDRVVVMPTLAPPRAPALAAPQPTFTPAAPVAGPPDDDVDDERPAPPVGAPPRGPVFNQFPQPQVVNPQQPTGYPQPQVAPPQPNGVYPPMQFGQPATQTPSSRSAPGAPTGGVAVPGMIVAPPPQPGQIIQPTPTQTPQKRPGGGGSL